jgi:hypothetical protein
MLANKATGISPMADGLPVLDGNHPNILTGTSSASIAFLKPSRNGDDSLNAIAAKRAGRVNAASIDEKEVEQLLEERATLINKKFDTGLSKAETRRLALVRWNLDRIQDARHGEALDDLEAAVSLYEQIGHEITNLMHELRRFAPHGERK